MPKKRDRIDSLLEWAESTFGCDISHRIASESPHDEAAFWKTLNKVRAAQKQKYKSPVNSGTFRLRS
jgi:hypothetical protein